MTTDNDMSGIDHTELEYPDGDRAEVFDIVARKGPISHDSLMDQIYAMSSDEVFNHLRSLRDDGYVDSRDGDLSKDGTTRDLWYVTPGTEQ
jgi:transcription initiation factor IIE alpha subunit